MREGWRSKESDSLNSPSIIDSHACLTAALVTCIFTARGMSNVNPGFMHIIARIADFFIHSLFPVIVLKLNFGDHSNYDR